MPNDEPTSIDDLPKCFVTRTSRARRSRTSAAGRPRRAVEIRGLSTRNPNKISARRRFLFAVVVCGSAHVLSRARAIKRARTSTTRSRRDGARRHRHLNSRSSDPNAMRQGPGATVCLPLTRAKASEHYLERANELRSREDGPSKLESRNAIQLKFGLQNQIQKSIFHIARHNHDRVNIRLSPRARVSEQFAVEPK